MKTLTTMLVVLVCLSTAVHAQMPVSVRQLVRQADFVGIVQTEPSASNRTGEWRQDVFVFFRNADAIKGSLLRDVQGNPYPWIKADHAGVAGYPTRFGERGEYLVFLHRTGAGSAARWTTLAAYRVQYYPVGLGGMFSLQADDVVGLLTSGVTLSPPPYLQPIVTVTEAQHWLVSLANGQPPAHRDEAKLNAFFQASLLSAEASLSRGTPTREERLALATKLAEAVTPGMTRAQVEKLFPESDGGAFGSDQWRYYFGSEIMIGVPYDTNGGPFQPDNRVRGPLRVYRAMMHLD